MAYNAGELTANLRLNMRDFTSGMRRAATEARNLGDTFRNSFRNSTSGINDTRAAIRGASGDFKDFERIVGGIVLSQVFYGVIASIKDASSAVVEFTGNMEKAQIAMEYFLETPQAATGFLASMQDFAATTSFNTEQAITLSRRLMGAQFKPTEVRGVMETLGDASAATGGTAVQMDRIVLALSQMKTNGKIAGQELRQLAEAGIPIYKLLQEELGLTGKQIMNIGKMQISGDLGVNAVLTGLEKRYKGAALRIADTLPGLMQTIQDDSLMLSSAIIKGPYKAMEVFFRGWRDNLEKARAALNDGGIGNVIDVMFSPLIATNIRLIVGSIKSFANSLYTLGKALAPIGSAIGEILVTALGMILPPLAGIVKGFAHLVDIIMTVAPWLKYVGAAILGLLVADIAAKSLLFLWNVLRIGVIANVVAGAVTKLAGAIRILYLALAANPIMAAIMLVVGGLMYLAMQSKTVIKWLDALTAKLASLGGFSVEGTLVPEDKTDIKDWMEEYDQGFNGIEDSITDTGDAAEKAGKKIKDSFLASFDEVFQVPEKKKEEEDKKPGGNGAFPGGLDEDIGKTIVDKIPRVIKLPEFEWPEIPLLVIPKPTMPKITWPVPPPVVVTSWEWIKLKIKEFGDIKIRWPAFPPFPIPVIPPMPVPVWPPFPVPVWPPLPIPKWPQMPLPQWNPLPLPQWGPMPMPQWNPLPLPKWGPLPMPNWNPVLEGVKNWGKDLSGHFDALKERLKERWGGAWSPMPGIVAGVAGTVANTVKGWASDLGKAFDGLADSLGTQWDALWGGLGTATTVGVAAIQVGFEALKVGAGLMGKQAWEATKVGWQTFTDGMKNLWENHSGIILGIVGALVLGIVLFFTGIPASVIAAVGLLVARIGPAFARMGPAVLGAIKGIPTIFRNIMSALPQEAQDQVNAVIDWFKSLPERSVVFFEEVKTKFKEKMYELAPEVGKAVSEILKWFKALPGQIASAIKTIPTAFGVIMDGFKEKAKKALADTVIWFKELPGKVADGVKALPGNMATMFTKIPPEALKSITGVITYFQGLPSKIGSAVTSIPNNMANLMAKLGPNVSRTIEGIVNFFRGLPGKVSSAVASLPSGIGSIVNKLPGLATTAIGKIVAEFKKLPGKIIDGIKDIPKRLAGIFGQIKLPSFETLSGGVKATFKSIGSIAGFADGGIIDKDSIIRVGEGGRREAIVPLQNQSAMQPYADAVANQVLSRLQGQNTGQGNNDQSQPTLYVEYLIADDRGLKELERRMQVIRVSEQNRRGGK